MNATPMSGENLFVRIGRLLFIGIAILLVREGRGADAPWWNTNWQFRYEISLPRRPESDTAWVKFNIPPGSHLAGDDVRIVNDRRRLIPHQTLFFAPALYGIVAFEIPFAAHDPWLYLGNPDAPPPDKWTARAGLLLTTYRKSPGDADNWRQMRQLARDCDYAFGAGLRGNVFDGFNPFGEPDGFLSHYSGWFLARRSGSYTFHTVSDDASFLLVDGRMAAKWGGVHGPEGGPRGQRKGKIDLTPGTHKFDYYHVDFGGSQTAVAAWIPPTERAPRVMVEEDFAPIDAASVGYLEIRDQPLAPDFSARQIDWLMIDDITFSFYEFHEQSGTDGALIQEREWLFDDGQSATGGNPRKLFFNSGDHSIRLTIVDDQGRKAALERPFRVHAIDRIDMEDDPLRLETFAARAEASNLDGLSSMDKASAARLLAEAGRRERAQALFESALARPEHLREPETVARAYLRTATGLDPSHAVSTVRRVVDGVRSNRDAAELLMEIAHMESALLNEQDQALLDLKVAALRSGKAKDESRLLERRIWVAQGDTLRRKGAPEEARQAYQRAESIPLPGVDPKPFDRASYALTVESRLASNDLDEARGELDRWENERPTEKLVGYSTILRSRLDFMEKNYDRAVSELEIHLRNNHPVGAYAKVAMRQLVEMYSRGGEPDKAREMQARLERMFQSED